MCVFHTNISCKNFTFFGFKELNSPPTYSFIVSVGVQPRHRDVVTTPVLQFACWVNRGSEELGFPVRRLKVWRSSSPSPPHSSGFSFSSSLTLRDAREGLEGFVFVFVLFYLLMLLNSLVV